MQKDGAKEKLFAALKKLIEAKPIEQISVTELVQEAGITRQAFYLYYRDKYDLVLSAFKQLSSECAIAMQAGTTLHECLAIKFDFIRAQGRFFAEIFSPANCTASATFKSSIEQGEYDATIAFYTDFIGRITQAKLYFQLRLYCHGFASMTTDWALHGMKDSSATLAENLTAALPPLLVEAMKDRL